MYIELEELMEKLKMAFGDLDDDCGCYVDHKNEYGEMAWLSIKAIKDVIDVGGNNMALYMTINNEYALQKIFADWDRDYYSLDGYKAILDYYDETETDSELDVIAICGSFTEYNIDELLHYYGETDFESWLNDNRYIENWLFDNDFDDVEDVENAGMINNMNEELKEDCFDGFVEEQLDYINYNYTCFELDNGNYVLVK